MVCKAIIFDFFGVICSEVSPVWFGAHFPGQNAQKIKEEYVGPADRGEIKEDQLFGELEEKTSEPREVIQNEWNDLARIDPAVIDLIDQLRGRYKIGLLSNAPGHFIRGVIEKYDLGKLFDHIIVSSEVRMTKSQPEMFLLALGELGVSPQEAVMIDDTPAHVATARSVGMAGLVFTSLPKLKDDLAGLGVILGRAAGN